MYTARRLTVRGYDMMDVVSALQKAVRRGDAKLAGYWAMEMYESNLAEYCWRRMLIISAEDCWGAITNEIESLYRSYQIVTKVGKSGFKNGKVFVAKAAILLAQASKCRDADHVICLVYERKLGLTDAELEAAIEEARSTVEPIPEYALDCHTAHGRAAGKTRADFIPTEFKALSPRQPGLFDDLVP